MTESTSRMLIVGNSVSASPAQGIPAYPELLEELLAQCEVVKIIHSGRTIDNMESEILSALGQVSFSVMVLQVGINECGPRPLSRQERARLSKLRPVRLRMWIIKFLHNYRPHIIRWRGLNQFTPRPKFVEVVGRVVKKAVTLNCAVLILPITHVTATAEIRQPFFNREIDRYNAVLRSFSGNGARYIEQRELFGDMKPDEFCITPESVHLNGMAHEKIASLLVQHLQGLEE